MYLKLCVYFTLCLTSLLTNTLNALLFMVLSMNNDTNNKTTFINFNAHDFVRRAGKACKRCSKLCCHYHQYYTLFSAYDYFSKSLTLINREHISCISHALRLWTTKYVAKEHHVLEIILLPVRAFSFQLYSLHHVTEKQS